MPRVVSQTGISTDIWVDKKTSNECVSSTRFTSLICLTEHQSSVGFFKLSSYAVGFSIFFKLDSILMILQLEFEVIFKIQQKKNNIITVSITYSQSIIISLVYPNNMIITYLVVFHLLKSYIQGWTPTMKVFFQIIFKKRELRTA